jgi:hypothetical protein
MEIDEMVLISDKSIFWTKISFTDLKVSTVTCEIIFS